MPVECEIEEMVETFIIGREESEERLRDPRRDHEPNDPASGRDEQAFREELPCETPPTRA